MGCGSERCREVCKGFFAHLLNLLPTTLRHKFKSVGKVIWNVRHWIGPNKNKQETMTVAKQ